MGKNISELKQLFDVSLSDTTNLPACKSGEAEERKKTEVPTSYDWRKASPVESTLSAVSDHICAGSNRNHTVQLSGQEILDCPTGSRHCKGGSVNHVLSWGKRKGFIEKSCYADKVEQDDTCPEDHIYDNECRV